MNIIQVPKDRKNQTQWPSINSLCAATKAGRLWAVANANKDTATWTSLLNIPLNGTAFSV